MKTMPKKLGLNVFYFTLYGVSLKLVRTCYQLQEIHIKPASFEPNIKFGTLWFGINSWPVALSKHIWTTVHHFVLSARCF